MSDPEFINKSGTNSTRLRDLKPTSTDLPLVVDISETALTSLSCNSEIGARIQALNVRSCRLNSLIGLSYLTRLEELDIGFNQLKIISSDRDDCKAPSLARLIADHNEISTVLPNPNMSPMSFVGFPNLVHLDLSYNLIEKLEFALTLSPQLRYLNISHNQIADLFEFNHLHNLTNLEEVEFEGNPCNDFLNNYKQMILVKAIILGELETVNKVKLNDRDKICAESLHVDGIRKYRPEKHTHDELVEFVNAKVDKMNNKALDVICSQQRKNSERRESVFSKTYGQNTFEGATPKTSRVSTNNPKIRRSVSLTVMPPPRSLPRVVEEKLCTSVSIELPQPNTESNSTPPSVNSKMMNEFQEKFEKLFSMCQTHQQEIANLKLENSRLQTQQQEIANLKLENSKLREYIVKQDQHLNALNDQLSIVPTDMKIYQRKNGSTSSFILEWQNQLKAMQNVKGYELQLGEDTYRVLAPNRRVVMENPVDGQKIVLKAIQRSDDKPSDAQTFVFKQPDDAEDKENQ